LNRSFPYLLLGILLVGAASIAVGVTTWSKPEYGQTSRFYTIPGHFVHSNGYFLTWGMEGNAGTEPDAWHFHVAFVANQTAVIALLWSSNQSVLFSRRSANLMETFDVALPKTDESWSWDWMIKNPNNSTLLVENFTIVHYSIKYPERQRGLMLFSAGLAATLTTLIAEVYVWRRGIKPIPQKSFQSS